MPRIGKLPEVQVQHVRSGIQVSYKEQLANGAAKPWTSSLSWQNEPPPKSKCIQRGSSVLAASISSRSTRAGPEKR